MSPAQYFNMLRHEKTKVVILTRVQVAAAGAGKNTSSSMLTLEPLEDLANSAVRNDLERRAAATAVPAAAE